MVKIQLKKWLLSAAKKVLKDKKIFEFAGVTPNPELDQACSAINFAKSKKIEFMIAAGGGSVIDFTKFISRLLFKI